MLPGLLAACKDNELAIVDADDYGFREGVASFDPATTNVISWTRYTNASNEPDTLPCAGK